VKIMGYESEMKEEERQLDQEWRRPKPHGDVVTEDDLTLWKQQKQKQEAENE